IPNESKKALRIVPRDCTGLKTITNRPEAILPYERIHMTSVAQLIATAAATEQRQPTALGDTIGFGAPADITTTCDSQLTTTPWQIDTRPGYGPGASTHDTAPASTPHQGPIPTEYTSASETELHARIVAAKHALGDRGKIVGEFYQRDESG